MTIREEGIDIRKIKSDLENLNRKLFENFCRYLEIDFHGDLPKIEIGNETKNTCYFLEENSIIFPKKLIHDYYNKKKKNVISAILTYLKKPVFPKKPIYDSEDILTIFIHEYTHAIRKRILGLTKEEILDLKTKIVEETIADVAALVYTKSKEELFRYIKEKEVYNYLTKERIENMKSLYTIDDITKNTLEDLIELKNLLNLNENSEEPLRENEELENKKKEILDKYSKFREEYGKGLFAALAVLEKKKNERKKIVRELINEKDYSKAWAIIEELSKEGELTYKNYEKMQKEKPIIYMYHNILTLLFQKPF